MFRKIGIGFIVVMVLLAAMACTPEAVEEPGPEQEAGEEPIEWTSYENERFAFSISYPDRWTGVEAQNGDGITLKSEEGEQEVRAFGNELSMEASRTFTLSDRPGLTEGTRTLSNGLEGRTLSGEAEGRYYHEVLVVQDQRAVHLVFELSQAFYEENPEIVEHMSESLLVEKRETDEAGPLTRELALEIQSSLYTLLFDPTVREGSYEVVGYEDREALLQAALDYAEEPLVREYLNTYYREEEGKLVVVPTEGPARLSASDPIELETIDETTTRVIQEAENALWGPYRLEILYSRTEGTWRIADQSMELLDDGNN